MMGHYERPSRPRRRYTTDAPSSPSKVPAITSIKLPSVLNDILPPAAKAAETSGTRSRSVSSERLDTALQQTGTPSSDTTIDLRELGTKGFALNNAVLALLHEMFPDTWNDVTGADGIEVERVSGAMTNCVFIVSAKSSASKKVLLRVYGTGVEEFIEREHELVWMSRLSDMSVGPKLLGVFANGRFEQFLDSAPLSKDSMREPSISCKIAAELCRFHSLIRVCPPEELSEAPDLFAKMRSWYRKANAGLVKLDAKRPEQAERLRAIRLHDFEAELHVLEDTLRKIKSPVVFAHNDSQYGNILKLTGKDEIVLVDYEYASINFRGYDIGNHFCEWGADYHSPTPHLLDFTRYPSKAEQLRFLRAYLETSHTLHPMSPSSLSFKTDEEAHLEEMYKECNKFALCSHALWGFWGVMQAAQNDVISFDYVGYAVCRLGRYWDIRDEVFGM